MRSRPIWKFIKQGFWAFIEDNALSHGASIAFYVVTGFVPALVIGSKKDRLVPIGQSRKIADAVPNLAKHVELPGGHCSMLERPDEINRHLRELVESVTEVREATS